MAWASSGFLIGVGGDKKIHCIVNPVPVRKNNIKSKRVYYFNYASRLNNIFITQSKSYE